MPTPIQRGLSALRRWRRNRRLPLPSQSRIPVRFAARATLEEGKDGAPHLRSSDLVQIGPDFRPPDGVAAYDLVYADPVFIDHYFHFVELLITSFTIQFQHFPQASPRRIFVGHQRWNNARQNMVQGHLLAAVYPQATIVEGFPPSQTTLSNAVLVDRGLAITSINKFLDPLSLQARTAFPALRERILGSVAPERSAGRDRPRLLYVGRRDSRRLPEPLESRLMSELGAAGIEVSIARFEDLSWIEQVRLTMVHDGMIGVHGNGLTNLLWLPPRSIVIELFPVDVHHYDYQMLSEIAGHTYFGFEGREDGHVFRDFDRRGEPRGVPHHATIDSLPWDILNTVFRDLSSRSSR